MLTGTSPYVVAAISKAAPLVRPGLRGPSPEALAAEALAIARPLFPV